MDTYFDNELSPSVVVSFRLRHELAQVLSQKAAKQQLSLNLYVRDVFLDAIAQADVREGINDVLNRIESLHQEVTHLPSTIFQLWEEQENWDTGE